MITRVETLVDVAKEAGIDIPPHLTDFDEEKFPHWKLLCIVQVDRSIPYGTAVLDNAKIIAALTDLAARKTTFQDISGKLA